jgi:hypothetical protein
MIGLYLHRDGLRFCAQSGDSMVIYDHDLDDRPPWNESWIESGFELAKAELKFTFREDFRLLVDRPHAMAVSQSVPFGEKQLPQVLENFLEEELPEDIEDFQFDYRVLHTKGTQSAVLGFWIRKKLLTAWCHFSDEQAFNSLDIQPAESVLLPSAQAMPTLRIYKDLQQRVRFGSLQIIEGLPQMILGILPSAQADKLEKLLRLQGSRNDNISQLEIDPELSELFVLQEKFNIPERKENSPAIPSDPFSSFAFNDAFFDLHFRKGEFVQKGISERLLYPVLIATVALCAWLGTVTWANHQSAQTMTNKTKVLSLNKNKVWKRLFPQKRVPQSRMSEQMKGHYKEFTGESNNKSDDEHISSLQALGLLFTSIKPDDEVLIERASIGKSITLTGTSAMQDRIYNLSEGFKKNSDFREPNITSTKRGKEGETPVYQFRFSTAYIGDE